MYRILYHKLVLEEDLRRIAKSEKKKIFKAIDKKLSKSPEVFGKPLGANLKGYFRLRIDFYRVIYRIEKSEVVVFVVKIGLRKNLKAYLEAAKRLGLIK